MAVEPITREEKLLDAVSTGSPSGIEPITREEMYLAYIGGQDVIPPEPITRKEQLLSMIAPNGGSGVVIRNQNKTITANGSYKADSGYTGLGTVTVNVPQEEAVLQDKTVTENGTVTADAGFDGLGVVTVNVAASGGGDGEEQFVALAEKRLAEFVNDTITVFKVPMFRNYGMLKKVSLANLTTIENSASFLFENNPELEEVDLPKLVDFWYAAGIFSKCTALKTIRLPSNFSLSSSTFQNCTSLATVDLGSIDAISTGRTISSVAFINCASFATLILRCALVTSLSNINAFNGTPFASGGTGGTVYVPSALITQYQQETNWSTLYAAGTCNFVAIEGSEYE